jgi:adenylylsulfate kinase
MGFLATLAASGGVTVVVSATAPQRHHRDAVREDNDQFLEIWLRCGEEARRERDRKGLYRRFDRGEIQNLPGKDAEYEPPFAPELVLNTEEHRPVELVDRVMRRLEERGIA